MKTSPSQYDFRNEANSKVKAAQSEIKLTDKTYQVLT